MKLKIQGEVHISVWDYQKKILLNTHFLTSTHIPTCYQISSSSFIPTYFVQFGLLWNYSFPLTNLSHSALIPDKVNFFGETVLETLRREESSSISHHCWKHILENKDQSASCVVLNRKNPRLIWSKSNQNLNEETAHN